MAPETRSLTDTLAWLVDIPSQTGAEEAIRDALADRLFGLPTTIVRKSLVVGEPGPDSVLLAGHTDTVPLQGDVGARISGGRLHGLGATDMKGGLAVMVHLLEDLGTERVVGVFYAGEEGPMSGNELGPILDAIPALEEVEAAIVMEPTNREIHAGCQGSINATVSFIGEAAHSARPWLGVNAVTRAGQFLTKMDRLQPELHPIEGLEFKEVVSVTRAGGGVANNIIPSRFDLNVNYRFSPDRTEEQAIAHLRLVCEDADEFEVADSAPAAYPHMSHPLFQQLAEKAGAPVSHKQGWTDVAQLAQRGIPAINFGPGETTLAHKPGESIALDDLGWARDALAAVLS
ncbi:MAG TPA: succinyl-diaminopimelate desuccinylase [Acidimicrobiia bacterium]|nr:succinyl-diaminopimelate desuccinylase [Acidimicrobiia bacterium]